MEAGVVKMNTVGKVEVPVVILLEAMTGGVTVHLQTEGEMTTEDSHLDVEEVQGRTERGMMKGDLLQDEMDLRHTGNGTRKAGLLQGVDAVPHQVTIEGLEAAVQEGQGEDHQTGQPLCQAMAGDRKTLLQPAVLQGREEEVQLLKMVMALHVKAVMAESLRAGNFLEAQTKIF